MAILLTGGAGYIGSHTAVELMTGGNDVVILDDLRNSHPSVIERIAHITGKSPAFYQSDASDKTALRLIFSNHNIDAVVHFAGCKAVGESVEKPLMYYRNNLDTTLSLLEIMQEYGCNHIIFSSSATVYSKSKDIPYTEENTDLGCTNPYGWTKLMNEQILTDAAAADPSLSVVLLRYLTPSVHTNPAVSVNSPMASRIISCPISHRLPPESARISRYSVTIIPPPTAPASATIFMSSISRRDTPQHWIMRAATRALRSSISAPVSATAYSMSSMPSKRQIRSKFPIKSSQDVPAISPYAMRIRKRLPIPSTGTPKNLLRICAAIPGAGSRVNPQNENKLKSIQIRRFLRYVSFFTYF